LHNLPLSGSNGAATDQTLGGLANIQRSHSSSVFSQSDIQPVVEVLTAIQDRDLGGVAADIQKIIAAHAGEVPTGSKVILQGQVQTMNAA
ncbi:hypothetical protein O6495_24495, partial [Salmonella enterica subsp. enterica]